MKESTPTPVDRLIQAAREFAEAWRVADKSPCYESWNAELDSIKRLMEAAREVAK